MTLTQNLDEALFAKPFLSLEIAEVVTVLLPLQIL